MSGMDRLTINDLEYWEEYGDYDAKLMARELLAHRRASQAAPAEEWEACTCGPCPLHPAAPALSDGLREALERIAQQQMYRSGYDQTDISVEPVLTASEMQEIACAALSAAPVSSDGLREAVDTAWNDAIEAAAEAKGYEHLAERAAIRALRRAAPTEGEA